MSPRRYLQAVAYASAALLLSAGMAIGQVDHRVNRGNVGGTGQALDANPALGSGGLNRSNPYVTDFGARSNALISGNLSGLASFKGGSPIPTGNGFRLSLPSSGLSSFYGTSVGIPQVRTGGVPLPTYYFGREQTIADLSYIRQGLNQPGSTLLRSTETSPQLVSPPRIQDFSNAIPDPVDLRIDVDRQAQLRDIGVVKLERLGDAPRSPAGTPGGRSSYESAVGSSLFGIPDVKSVLPDYRQPVDAVRALEMAGDRNADEQDLLINALRNTEPIDTRVETGDIHGIDTREGGKSRSVGSSPTPAPAQVSPGFEVITRRPGELPQTPQTPAATGEARLISPVATPDPEVGLDKFHDMVMAIRAVERGGLKPQGVASISISGSSANQGDEPTDDTVDAAAARMRGESRETGDPAELAASIRWASDVLESPITTFAGAHADDFNRYMLAGEDALRSGRYYDAARQFDLAHTIEPDNPLPLLHRGHALVAAGDFTSASRALQDGIRRFPQIAAFRIDLPAIAGKTTIFDIRRADLEKRLEFADHYDLRFLLGYLELYSGLADLGIENLEQAAKAAPPESIIAVFADLVVGREPLPDTQ